MVRIFTHKKRTYLGCERHRVDFKITVDHINFTSNQYFLANSHYVIFRKQNKNKQFVSKNRVLNANDLRMVHVDEKIKFRTCLFQDLTNRYLEKYLPKNKRFVVRQVTAVTDEELYVNCGYFDLPLDIYAMKQSGLRIEVPFVDPNNKAAGTVFLLIEHEPRTLVANYLPNISKTLHRYFFPAPTTRAPLPPSRLEINREKLEFVKQQQIEHHWSHKYDGLSSDDEEECDETHSESELGSQAGSEEGDFKNNSKSFIMNRTGMPQVSSKGLSSKNNYLSVHLDSAMFHFEDAGSDVPTPTNQRENAVFPEQPREVASASGSVTRVVSFDPHSNKAPSVDTMSTLSQSERGHLSPRAEEPEAKVKTEAKVTIKAPASPPGSPHHIEVPHHLTAKQGNTHVPFAGQSYKVRAGAALDEDTEDDQSRSTHHSEPTLNSGSIQGHNKPLVLVQPTAEVWEDVADFEKLELRERMERDRAERERADREEWARADRERAAEAEIEAAAAAAEGGSYKPRKSLRTVPPPLISDSSQFIAARTVQRSASMTDATMRENLPRYEPPAPVPQPPRKSLRGAPPPPAVQKDGYIPAKVVQRVNSESSASMAQYVLNMDSVDEREQLARGNSIHIPPYVAKPSENKDSSREGREKKGERGSVPRLVPVRLTAAQTAPAQVQPPASLVSHSHSPMASHSTHRHLPHRAQSTGDMYAGIGHRHGDHSQEVTSPVSVKELRRKYERAPSSSRPPMDREFSGTSNTSDGNYAPLSPKNLPQDNRINVRRTTSERSYSTLSTHTDLPGKRPTAQGSGKLLVPVRLQHSDQEQAYGQYSPRDHRERQQEQEISPLSTSTYNTTNTHRSPLPVSSLGQGQGQGHGHGHHLHRGVSQYTQPNHSNGHSNALDYDLRQEQHERYDRYHHDQHANNNNTIHRQEQRQHAPAYPHHHTTLTNNTNTNTTGRGHTRSHSDVPPSNTAHANHAHHHIAHTTHTLAPPIRLTANDYVPPQYERYVVDKHHTHIGHGAGGSGSSDKYSPREGSGSSSGGSGGYYDRQGAQRATPAYRGVYA